MFKPLLPSQAPSYVDLRSDDSMSNQCSDLRSAGKVRLYFFDFTNVSLKCTWFEQMNSTMFWYVILVS